MTASMSKKFRIIRYVFFLFTVTLIAAVLLIHLFEWSRLNQTFSGPFFQKDSHAIAVHTPLLQKEELFEEHPSGRINKQYNNKGFISATPTADEKTPGMRRIIFTGDSHTDGVVWTKENFCTILQDSLSKPEKPVEVFNAGCGFYSFNNYKGVLERNLYLKPDEFVMMVYTGNDFVETLFYNYKWFKPQQSVKQFRARLGWRYQYPLMYNSQSLAQVLYFSLYPGQQKEANEIAAQTIKEIKTICQTNQIRLTVVFVPSAFDIDKSYQTKIQTAYAFSPDQLLVNRRLTLELINFCKQESLRTIDLYELMQNGSHLYYPKDQHLNVEGNKMIARLLTPFFLR
jgi:hypothetical protein